MTKPDLRESILAHLRAAGAPIASRDLASRFLLIRHDDESTCHRLLAPYLTGHPSLVYTPGVGWIYRPVASTAPAAGPDRRGSASPTGSRPAPERPRPDSPLRDFVALAAEGAGPSGSGTIRVVSLQPVVAGEECGPEHLPAWAAEDDIDAAAQALRPGGGGDDAGAREDCLGTAELQILVETIGDLPIVCHRVAREAGPLLRACSAASLPFHPITISLAKLGHLLLGLKPRHAPSELAAALGLGTSDPDDCRGRVRLMTRCFLALLPMLEEIGITSFDELQTFQNQPTAALDYSPYAFTADDLKALPARPGIYRFHDRQGEVLYVGKAKNLRARLSSYFVPSARGTERGRAILERVHSYSFEVVSSELEALLNEAALLAELRPPLNRQFDVHQRPAPYGPRLNLIVVLPEPAAGAGDQTEACTVHFMRRGRYQGRIRGIPSPCVGAGEHRDRWQQLDEAVRAVYFQSRERVFQQAPAARGGGEGLPVRQAEAAAGVGPGRESNSGDIDWQLVASYLARYRDEVNVLDVDDCDSPERVLTSLQILAAATVGGEHVVAR